MGRCSTRYLCLAVIVSLLTVLALPAPAAMACCERAAQMPCHDTKDAQPACTPMTCLGCLVQPLSTHAATPSVMAAPPSQLVSIYVPFAIRHLSPVMERPPKVLG